MVAVDDLEFVAGHQKHAGVAVELAGPVWIIGGIEAEFEVDAGGPVGLLGGVAALAAWHDSSSVEFPVWTGPLGGIEHRGLSGDGNDAVFSREGCHDGGIRSRFVIPNPT